MPFESEKQRRFLWANKPEVARKFAEHAAEGKKIGGRRVTKGQKVGQSNIVPVLDTLSDLAPGIGEIKSGLEAKDAINRGDYAGAVVPIMGATPFFGIPARAVKTAAKSLGLTSDAAKKIEDIMSAPLGRKEKEAAELLGDNGENIVKDMVVEAQFPQLAKGENLGPLARLREAAPSTYRGDGAHSMDYRPYQTDKGPFVHSTYDDRGRVQNVLGGTSREPTPLPNPLDKVPTIGGARRPSGNFNPVTQAMKGAGHPGSTGDLTQFLRAQKQRAASTGPNLDKLIKQAGTEKGLSAKQQKFLDEQIKVLENAEDYNALQKLSDAGLYSRGGRVGPLGRK